MKTGSLSLVVLSFCAVSAYGGAASVNLGTAGNFAVLAGSTVTNAGDAGTVINGDLGVSPGTAFTDSGNATVNGTIYAAGYDTDAGVPSQAENDLTAAYNFAAGEACGTSLTGEDLGTAGTKTNPLTPGVYCFTSSAQLTGTLFLDAQGDPNAVFVFQIATTLTTASNSAVDFVDGVDGGGNVYWQVGSSATLGTGTDFAGNILADASITLNTGASIDCGSALASSGAVTLDDNTVAGCGTPSNAAPEPGSAALLSMGLFLGLIVYGEQCLAKLRENSPVPCVSRPQSLRIFKIH